MMRTLTSAVLVLFGVAVPLGAQSLGELAQKEAARRKAVEAAKSAPKKVWTNDDLKGAPPPPPTVPAAGTDAAAGAAKDAAAKDATAKKDDAAAAQDQKGEEYWHNRMAQAREDLRRNQMFAEALQSRINALTADYSSRDDPAQRAQIGDDRQKALAELDRVTKDIDRLTKQIADIEEEARQANVPPGWIR